MLRVAVLAGTTRGRRLSIHAARFVARVGESYEELAVTLADPHDFHFEGDGNDQEGRDPRYTALTAAADAFFVVAPEYNHSFPASLKRMLDSEYMNYRHKPVAFAGVSNGAVGGARAIEALVTASREMGLIACSWDVRFPRVQDIFDLGGNISPADRELYERLVRQVYDELIWMARTLKWGRENIS